MEMKRQILFALLVSMFGILAACSPGSKGGPVDTGKIVKSGTAGNLTVEISSPSGAIKHGGDEFFVTFKDSSGKPVDVGAAGLVFHMPGMGTMAVMNDSAAFTTTDTPGVYRGKATVEMAGEWQGQITYEGPAGKGQTTIPVNVQ
jgi:hypothetical protein